MAQLGLLTDHQNHNSTYENNRSPINHKQSLSNYLCDSIKSESDNALNVLRWLQSLPQDFMIDDLKKNMNYCKLKKKARNLHRHRGNRSKSLGPSLKSADAVPLEEKGIMHLGNKQKVNFVDKLDATTTKSLNTKKKLMNRKRCKNTFVSRLPKKCGKSNLSSKIKSQQSSMSDNQCQGILKNISWKKMTSNTRLITIERQIASNKRLLDSMKAIINTVKSNHRVSRTETVKKDSKIAKTEKTFSILSNFVVAENSTKKTFIKNPTIEKKLDNAMRNTLKRYIHSYTWDDFKEKYNNNNGEPPVKKEKRAIPSLEPVNSFHMNLGQSWNANLVLNNLCPL